MRIGSKHVRRTEGWLATKGAILLAPVVLGQRAAAAGTISSVTPEKGTIGTVIVVEGLGFGEQEPNVLRRDPLTVKHRAAKVVGSSDLRARAA